MSGSNGCASDIIKIGCQGRRKFQFGDSLVIELDVVACHNRWMEMDNLYRDDKGNYPPDKLAELNQSLWMFVRQLIVDAAAQQSDQSRQQEAQRVARALTLAEAFEFLARLTEVALQLRSFFKVRSNDEPSSPANTELIFSTET